MSKLTFRGQLFCRTIAKRSDCHFEKMTLGDLRKSANMTKMSLRFEGFFVCSPFYFGRASCLQDPSENAHLRSKV